MCEGFFFLPECICTKYVAGDQEDQKRGLGPLELELWMVVNHHAGTGNQTHVLWQEKQVFLIIEISLKPHFPLYAHKIIVICN